MTDEWKGKSLLRKLYKCFIIQKFSFYIYLYKYYKTLNFYNELKSG